jgi:5-methylcytosine-specific restriction protein A
VSYVGNELSTTERGYGHSWQKRRKAVLRRDNGLCVECYKRDTLTIATDVDHIVRKADGGTDDMDNLQSLCRRCHIAKTRLENGAKGSGCDANGIPLKPNPYWS